MMSQPQHRICINSHMQIPNLKQLFKHSLNDASLTSGAQSSQRESIRATVVETGQKQTVMLNINGVLLSARVNSELNVGDHLQLRLTDVGRPVVVKALNMPLTSSSPPVSTLLIPDALQLAWKKGQPLSAHVNTSASAGTINAGESRYPFQFLNAPSAVSGNISVKLLHSVSLPFNGTLALVSLHSSHAAMNKHLAQAQSQPLIALSASALGALDLQQGQILSATISARDNSGKITINVLGKLLNSLYPYPIASNTQINLQIIDPGKVPLLTAVSPVALNPVLNQLIRQNLPLQQGLAALMSKLWMLSDAASFTSVASHSPQAANELNSIASQIISTMPRSNDPINSEMIKTWIQHSGIFLENSLLHGALHAVSLDLSGNLKAHLLRLLAILQRRFKGSNFPASQPGTQSETQPPMRHSMAAVQPSSVQGTASQQGLSISPLELMQLLRAAVARIQLHQAASLSSDDDPRKVISTEIPVRSDQGIDVLQLRIEEDVSQHDGAHSVKTWTAIVGTHLPKLGPLYFKLCLSGDKLSTHVWADNKTTLALLKAEISALQTRLSSLVPQAAAIQCHQGKPPFHNQERDHSQLILDISV